MKTLGSNTEKTKNITNPVVTDYINSFYAPLNKELLELREYAEEQYIPIILKESETFLKFVLEKVKPNNILEIGTAIGYSSIFFCTLLNDVNVVTLERMDEMIDASNINIKRFGFEDRIHVISGDAVEVLRSKIGVLSDYMNKFDILFIDAGKSKYIEFLEASLPYLKKDAIIICDNILMGARVASDEYDSKNKHRTNIRHLREFNEYINNLERFNTVILPIGDGMSVTTLK